MSQARLAAACGMSRTYVVGIERGNVNATLDSIEGLAEALGVEISLLLEPPLPDTGLASLPAGRPRKS